MTAPEQRSGGRVLGRAATTVVLAGVLAGVCAVVAAAPASARETVSVLAAPASIEQVLTNIRNWIIGILAGLATVFLTIGGVRYVLAGGDPGEVERARAALRSAAFGYALAVLAPLIVQILQGIVGT